MDMSEAKPDRRSVLKTFLVLPWAAALISPARAAVRTPGAAEGPFYPTPRMRFKDADNDLIRIKGVAGEARGEIVALQGRVLNRKGDPVEGARIEIWQCDAKGRYLHDSDSRPGQRDPAFQGFGHVVTDASGEYAFRTIKPVPYPGRAPHIHVKAISGNRVLTTQFYIAGQPQNDRDWLYRRMTKAQRKAVEMVFKRGANGPEAVVDVII